DQGQDHFRRRGCQPGGPSGRGGHQPWRAGRPRSGQCPRYLQGRRAHPRPGRRRRGGAALGARRAVDGVPQLRKNELWPRAPRRPSAGGVRRDRQPLRRQAPAGRAFHRLFRTPAPPGFPFQGGNMSAEIRAALLVSARPGMTPALMRQAAGRFASFAAYLAASPGDCPPPLDEPLRHYRRQRASCERGADVAAARLASLAIDLLPLSDTRYPALLREIDRPPPLLYVRGAVDLLSLPQLAIVGSRRASRGALEDARAFAAQLAGGGLVITSGLALGIDGAAHRGALATGRTIAVLGTGVDVVYPRQHAGLAAEILAAGGALVSEFPPGFPVRRESFPQRNRIISGLAMGVLVVEAAVKSGSLITARLAMEQGREV